MGRFLFRLKKVFNIDKQTRAFPVSSSMSAPATGIVGGWLAKLFSRPVNKRSPFPSFERLPGQERIAHRRTRWRNQLSR